MFANTGRGIDALPHSTSPEKNCYSGLQFDRNRRRMALFLRLAN